MGSVCDTIRSVVDELNNKGDKVGMVEVHLYRPFSKEYLLKELPASTEQLRYSTELKNLAVLKNRYV